MWAPSVPRAREQWPLPDEPLCDTITSSGALPDPVCPTHKDADAYINTTRIHEQILLLVVNATVASQSPIKPDLHINKYDQMTDVIYEYVCM